MKNSLMYKMSYYRFSELYGGHPAQDRVRGQRIPAQSPTLDSLGESSTYTTTYWMALLTLAIEEAFTSENWIVRIYAVKKEDSLGRAHQAVSAFDGGKKLKKSPSALDASAKVKARPST